MNEEIILQKLEKILAILDRMEQRQVNIKEEIASEPVVGSFASSEPPQERERTGH